ncbi:MAG: exonuclease SbcCD subunit D C-terminal domain-containing protein [Tannerella sp.]|jgi:exonuclease SbcD|nr:exonuclease SbcCD subunit D C-terminal domain-containing protein [Tannerella sp.]
MLKILHTADWHLGQTFYDFERQKEHLHFLSEMRRIIAEREIDALLIAGDVFDSPNPPAEAQEMYYRFLYEVTSENPDLQIIIIAGNHDSAARLEAPAALLRLMNVHVRGIVKRTEDGAIDYRHLIVPIRQGDEITAWCLAVPYLRYGDYPPAENLSKSVEKLFTGAYSHIPDKSLPVIAMAHLHASGATISKKDKSERIIIGGEEGIRSEAFPEQLSYVALGHLHRAQHLPHRNDAYYSGAPLPMSFAERTNKQLVIVVELADNKTDIEKIELHPLISLQSIFADSITELIERLHRLPEGDKREAPYLELIVRITEPEPSLRNTVEDVLKTKRVQLARLTCFTQKDTAKYDTDEPVDADLHSLNPIDLAVDIFNRRGYDMLDTMYSLLTQVIKNETDS